MRCMAANAAPNILLITSDQQHWDTLGVTNPRIKTPALDRLCREGTRFDRAYCPNPTCSPTRASIITGQYPAWHGCWTIGVKTPEDVLTVGDVFQQHGYASILVGKAHFQPLKSVPGSESLECQPTLRDLDFWRRFHGPWYGFSHVETARMHGDESHVGQHYAIWMEEHGLKDWAEYFQPWPPKPNKGGDDRYFLREGRHWKLPEKFHHTRWIAERTIANLQSCAARGKPFFLWSSFFDPHPPYIISEPWASMYQPGDMVPGRYTDGEFDRMPPHFGKTREPRPDYTMYDEPGGAGLHGFHSHLRDEQELKKDIACYYGMVSFMDQQIGLILDALDRLGMADNTLVVFTSDHGHYLGQHGLIAKGPFHYEDGVRVPMIVRTPGVAGGGVSRSMQSLVDYAPSFLSYAGIKPPGQMQGVDQSGVWAGRQDSARDHVIVENRHNPTKVHLRTYIDQRYKVTVYRDQPYGELFDLEADPQELRNLWDEPSAAGVKARLLHRFVQADLQREPTRMPRVTGA